MGRAQDPELVFGGDLPRKPLHQERAHRLWCEQKICLDQGSHYSVGLRRHGWRGLR